MEMRKLMEYFSSFKLTQDAYMDSLPIKGALILLFADMFLVISEQESTINNYGRIHNEFLPVG